MNKLLSNILCSFIPFKELRHNIRSGYKLGKNNKIIIVKDGKEYIRSCYEFIDGLVVKISGNNNIVRIELPFSKRIKTNLKIFIINDNNVVKIGKNFCGELLLNQVGDNNYFEVGDNFGNSGNLSILSVGNTIKIGNECMCADNVEILCDGHAVVDAKTRECINIPSAPVLVGDHVWLGRRCVLLKGAQIPNNSIVATRSVVTKKFDEPNCLIAGQPAKVVKTGIDWVGETPVDYVKNQRKNNI